LAASYWLQSRKFIYQIAAQPDAVFTHRTDDVDTVVRTNGLKRRYYRRRWSGGDGLRAD
jgi:hypothetical protein